LTKIEFDDEKYLDENFEEHFEEHLEEHFEEHLEEHLEEYLEEHLEEHLEEDHEENSENFSPNESTSQQSSSRGNKRTYHDTKIVDKVRFIQSYETSNLNFSEFGRGNQISRCSLINWLRNKDKLVEAKKFQYSKGVKKLLKRLKGSGKKTKFTLIEQKMVEYVKNNNDRCIRNIPRLVKLKAEEIARNLNIQNFKASAQWLHRFKLR
jgi:hypothetical protein